MDDFHAVYWVIYEVCVVIIRASLYEYESAN